MSQTSRRVELYSKEISDLVFQSLRTLESRTPRLISPNFTGRFELPSGKESDVLLLAYLHWFLPDDWRCLVRLFLEEQPRISKENKVLLNFVLKDKNLFLIWYSENTSERAFFGNQLKRMSIILEELRPILRTPRKAKNTQRRRGYQDHGTLRPDSKWIERSDWSLTEEQNHIEQERQTLSDTSDFLEGWFT
jgi:hypothetical protein